MIKNIEKITEIFLIDGNEETFKKDCCFEISSARPSLKHHSGWINILDLFIYLIQILFSIIRQLASKSNHHITFFTPTIAKTIDQLEAAINTEANDNLLLCG